jgi:predicted DNA-binding transcriptional regulator AlpA
MADRRDITREEFIGAAVTLATVAAGTMWDRFHDELTLIARPGSDSVWLDGNAARKHVKFAHTKFRALIKKGAFPQGVKIGGKLMWDRRELDRAMQKLFRTAKHSARKKELSKQSGATGSEARGTNPRKPR